MLKRIKNILKQLFKFVFIAGIIVVALVVYANWEISHESQKYIYDDVDSIPEHNVALVLGTSRYIGNRPNLYFTYRITAAKELYDAGKIDAFVVSGDNKHVSYNEPREMRRALVEAGVPDSIINADYAGFRTLDSVVRMNKVFGQSSYIIVSQEFHNERAIYIARHYGIDAYGYNARDLNLNRSSYKTKIRELFARVKVFIDILFGTTPKFLGEPIPIEIYERKTDSVYLDIDSNAVEQSSSL